MAWVTVATAPSQIIAEMWQQLVEDAGIEARILPSAAAVFGGVMNSPCRVQAPEERARDARSVLSQVADAVQLGE